MRYLTKTLFREAIQCPTRPYYATNGYPDSRDANDFLAALADGGYQVGALAKAYYPDGIEVDTLDPVAAMTRTAELMKQRDVVIFEAAFMAMGNCLVRTDILIKTGDLVEVIEVKAKSYDKHDENEFIGKSGVILAKWKPYLYDLAFQRYVVQSALPECIVTASFFLSDKSAVCPVDGLNQKLPIQADVQHVRGYRTTSLLNDEDLKVPMLELVTAEPLLDLLEALMIELDGVEHSFESFIRTLSDAIRDNRRLPHRLGAGCKTCPFNGVGEVGTGARECWKPVLGDAPLSDAVIQLWKFRGVDAQIKKGVYTLHDLDPADLKAEKGKSGMSESERRRYVVDAITGRGPAAVFYSQEFRNRKTGWRYPFNMIDFETTRVPIPFFKGRRPYEQIAFQFSHHVLHEDGRIVHETEWICTEKGVFPNYDFVRQLRAALSRNEGTIFRWAMHEATVLREIADQLQADPAPPTDVAELLRFIDEVCPNGPREMVDMELLCRELDFDLSTLGRTSIKKQLPAVLKRSRALQNRFSQPVYGSDRMHVSKNFQQQAWVQFDETGGVIDPYKLLPPVYDELDGNDDEETLAEGGAAMTAWNMMQFSTVSPQQRDALSGALRRYCELDTLAMVFIMLDWCERMEQP